MGRPVRAGLTEQSNGIDAFRESGVPSGISWAHAQRGAEALDVGVLRGALEHSAQATLIADGDRRIVFANAAAERLLRCSQSQLLHASLHDGMFELLEGDADCLGRPEPGSQQPQRLNVRLPDGRVLGMSQRTLQDRWGRTSHVCLELEADREALRAGSSLDLIGRLAGELAHDINNQLSAALNYVFVLQRRLGRATELTPHLAGLQSATWQAAMLADGLKLIARRRSTEPESLQLEAVVTQLTPLLRHLAHGARVELRCDHAVPRVRAPLAYAEQLVITLALTALGRGEADRNLLIRIGSAGASGVRLSCEPTAGGPSLACAARMARSMSAPRGPRHGALRRAVKLCRARLGHDGRRVFADFSDLPTAS
jgi:nitrogen-specific signal transduction histidine kinase